MARPSELPTPVQGTERRPSIQSLTPASLPSVFQPIVDLSNGSVFANEALVRCNDPGYPSPLGLFQQAVLEGTCGQLGRSIRQALFDRVPAAPIFVNLHPHELQAPWLVRPDDPICFHEHVLVLVRLV